MDTVATAKCRVNDAYDVGGSNYLLAVSKRSQSSNRHYTVLRTFYFLRWRRVHTARVASRRADVHRHISDSITSPSTRRGGQAGTMILSNSLPSLLKFESLSHHSSHHAHGRPEHIACSPSKQRILCSCKQKSWLLCVNFQVNHRTK